MQAFKEFYIHLSTYSHEEKKISFHYSFDKEVFFHEQILLPDNFPLREDIAIPVIENILFHTSIAFWISYYKLFPTERITVLSWMLDKKQKTYWKNFYTQWLWEFFYENKIDFRNLCNFSSDSTQEYKKIEFSPWEKLLLPIWGGKDSIVSALLLEEKKVQNITPFIFWKTDSIKEGFLKIYKKEKMLVKRVLDSKLFTMNQEWYYNGHVPITGLISFIMTYICYVYDYKYIVFSNEKSANIWNTKLYGREINHQYSKSEDFRNDFKNYLYEYICTELKYKSYLDEYYEIEIAKIFAKKWKKYFSSFSSCNKNFSITMKSNKKWCNSCSKCLFVYIIMRPFITWEETKRIFWEEMYERKDLKELFLEVIWASGIKPFECVGEVEEAQLWVYLSLNKFSKLPYLLELFKLNHMEKPHYYRKLSEKYFTKN